MMPTSVMPSLAQPTRVGAPFLNRKCRRCGGRGHNSRTCQETPLPGWHAIRERELKKQAERVGHNPVRPKSIRAVGVSRDEVVRLKLLNEALPSYERCETRGECEGGPRPCPLVSCKYNLYLQVNPKTGTIAMQFPHLEPEHMPADKSCVLDVAEEGPHSLDYIGTLLNMTRERVRQIEVKALKRAVTSKESDALRSFVGQAPMHRPSALANAILPSSRAGTEPDADEEETRQNVPLLPHILDETVSDSQYAAAIRALWERVQQNRAPVIDSDTSIQVPPKSP